MLRDYYGRAPPSFFDCGNAATGRSLIYTSVARRGIDSAARARRKLLASVFRRFTEGFDTADFVRANALLTSHGGSARGLLAIGSLSPPPATPWPGGGPRSWCPRIGPRRTGIRIR